MGNENFRVSKLIYKINQETRKQYKIQENIEL